MNINELTNTELFEIAEKFEFKKTLAYYSNRTKSKIEALESIATDVFGAYWQEDKFYKAIFYRYIAKTFDVVQSDIEGYVMAIIK